MANLSDLTYFANRSQGGIGAEEVNSDRARAALLAAQQYDPGASFRPVYNGDGGLTGYTLDFDASKLPGTSGGSLGGTSGHGSGADYQIPFSTVQPHMQLGGGKVTDNSIYGRFTDNTNIEQPSSALDWLGPLGVIGFGLAAPALLGPYSTLGGASAGAGGAAASGGDLAGGLGGGAADELTATSSGIGAAGAPASGSSIAVSNWLAAHGIPTQLGLSDGALGAAGSESGLGLGSVAGKIPGAISAAGKIPGLLGNAPGGSGGGGLLNIGGGGSKGATEDALSLLKAFYGDPTLAGKMYLAQQRHGLLNG